MATASLVAQRNAAPEPSTLCPDLDISTERIILECLSPDPERRPASATTIAARLPHKDALSAVLAAGDTPSPDLVAASGDSEVTRPRVAWSWAAAVLIALAAGMFLRASHAKSVADQPPGDRWNCKSLKQSTAHVRRGDADRLRFSGEIGTTDDPRIE